MHVDPPSGYVEASVVPEGLNRKYLRLKDLRRLKSVFFSSRRAIEGMYSGRHATPQRGQSVEFRDYRQYIPGDDIGAVDWKVFGRSDKLFIKMYEHQADMTVHLVVDASASMAYRGQPGGKSKYDQACSLAAAIAFLIAKQQDRVSFAFAQRGLSGFHRSGTSMIHLAGILETMERTLPKDEAQLPEALRALAEHSKRRDLLIVFGDLLDDIEGVRKALATWISRGGEALVFHVLHADELQLPKVENGLFIDSESDARLRLNVDDVRPEYERRLREFLEGWTRVCRGHGIDYNLVSTADDYSRALERYLFRRAARV